VLPAVEQREGPQAAMVERSQGPVANSVPGHLFPTGKGRGWHKHSNSSPIFGAAYWFEREKDGARSRKQTDRIVVLVRKPGKDSKPQELII